MSLFKCTRKGCGKEYSEEKNVDNACQFHAGAPVFHEGLKGWSCCKKRVSDFDEFLQIPGCTYGKHSNEKPVEPVKQQPETTTPQATSVKDGVEVYGEQKPKVVDAQPKAPAVEPAGPIEKVDDNKKEVEEVLEEDDETIPVKVGTTCKRRGCGVEYKDNETSRNNGSESTCRYHPGAPVFHEGSKGWSCCSRKVLEFEEFLKIKGCKEGKHLFVGSKKEGEQEELVDCRIDWYQTQTNVIISIFAKNKEDSQIKFTSRSIDVNIKMKDNKRYKKQLPLFHLIDPDTSKFTVLSTKVEINLKKTNGISWAALEPTKDVKTWTTFGVQTGGTTGTVGSKEMHYSADSPLHLKD
ncbi:unnamed protein product [Cunninghamella blakesleeana]